MFTNLYTTEKLAAARQRELREEAAKQRLLAELTGDRQPWTRRAAQYLWAWLGTLGAQREGTHMATIDAVSATISLHLQVGAYVSVELNRFETDNRQTETNWAAETMWHGEHNVRGGK